MNRYYAPAGMADWPQSAASHLSLTAEEAKHCTRVMRQKVGDQIEVFDGAGSSATCHIESTGRDRVDCLILEKKSAPPSPHPITLFQAIPKGGNMELIIQKATELGVSEIQPLITTRTVARPEASEKKQAKWQRTAIEACKQCSQNHLPLIHKTLAFPECLENFLTEKENFPTALIAALDKEALHLKSHLTKNPLTGKIALLIGPEGDFTPDEYQAAYRAGFAPISLGKITLRVETATLYTLSILQYELS